MRSTGLVNDCSGLVDGNIKQADCIGGKHFSRARDGRVFALPADAAYPQTEYFVVAKAGEEPGHRERPAQSQSDSC